MELDAFAMELGAFALELVTFVLEFIIAIMTGKNQLLVTKWMIFAMEDATLDSRRQLKLVLRAVCVLINLFKSKYHTHR